MHNKFDTLINSYLINNVGIDKIFLTEGLSKGLQQNIRKLQEDDYFSQAGIGNEKMNGGNQQMRGDIICWLDKSNKNVYEQEFLELAEEFISYLNNTCYTGIKNYEFHYAVYNKGSFYKKHIDQFKTDNKRKFSFINYLNENWMDTDGGQLHLYKDNEIQRIQPESKTAVFFKSDEMEHEVVLCKRSRMSISGWLKNG